MEEMFNLSDKTNWFYDCEGNEEDCYKDKDVKEFIKRLKESLITDDISIYDYRKETYTNEELQKAVEEQIDRIMKDINKLAGKKLI